MKKFAAWCGQEEGNFSGSWDLGHQLQIAYGKVMKENMDIQQFNRKMYGLMSEHKSHQAGIRFKEIADELNYAVLTNKGAQETRWVRAELRSVQTYLRNLPALGVVYGRDEENCAKNFDVTGQKEAKRCLDQIRDPEVIAFAVGLCQILEAYSAVSVAAQSIETSPSKVPVILERLQDTLRKLGETWSWDTNKLEMSNIGTPAEIIQELKSGEYTPYLSTNAKICAAKRINSSIGHDKQFQATLAKLDNTDVVNLQEDVPANLISAGSLPTEVFPEETKAKIEEKLSNLANDVLKQLEVNVKTPQYLVEGHR